MKIYHGLGDKPRFERGVATLGSFDGVHCGHRALLAEVRRRAAMQGVESVVYTFEPHPRITLRCAEGLKLLNTTAEKAVLLEAEGIDNIVFIPFTEEFSRLSPQAFISDYIVACGIGTLVVGFNHRFGRDKQGDYAYLSSSHQPLWPEVVEVEQQFIGDEKVSSTILRQVIAGGDMARARYMLGRDYIFAGSADGSGRVVSDDPQYKLLPPAGRYRAVINGCECTVCISDDGVVTADIPTVRDERVYINIGVKYADL